MADNIEGNDRPARQKNKKRIAAVLLIIFGIIAAVSIFMYVEYKKTHISTDDAFIDGNVHTIAPKIYGTVKAVYVADNQFAAKGTLLALLDPVDYRMKTEEAKSGSAAQQGKVTQVDAQILAARRQLAQREAEIESARATVTLEEAKLTQSGKDAARARNLYKEEAIPKQRFEQLTTDYDVAAARRKSAKDSLRKAIAAYATQKAVLKELQSALKYQKSVAKQSEATLEIARLNESYTRIYAPVDGYVTKKSVEVGNQVQPGQPLMALVPLSDIWVTANYKETQIEKMRPGQDVDIYVDTYPGVTFHGKVNSIMAGTGSVFSLFPPENATGNYVKVVQRIPVKITINPGEDPNHLLRLGMSVTPVVLTK
ncbi:MAG: HlyD family secretion protein [Nitrospiraceae bacterium]|nr:HlyD family secretion protein [Nitrospiraceae bacterium]